MIIIDKISTTNSGPGASSTLTVQHIVTSQDAILVVGASYTNSVTGGVTANGSPLPQIVIANGEVAIWVLLNPRVGKIDVSLNLSGSAVCSMTTLSILGVNKRSTNFITASITSAVTNRTIQIQPAQANSMIIDATSGGSPTSPLNSEQTMISNSGGARTFVMSYEIAQPGQQVLGWNDSNAASVGYVAIVLEPDQSSSIWYPNVRERSVFDVATTQGFNTSLQGSQTLVESIEYSSQFFKNSFLHTVGRLAAGINSYELTNYIDQNTTYSNQIVIDQVYEIQPSSDSSETFNVTIPSQEASVLVLTSGPLVGGNPNDVTFNNQSLVSNISQKSPDNLTTNVGIFYLPNPPIGVYPLQVVGGATKISAVIMILLGADKKINPVVVSTNGTGQGLQFQSISPNANNSLIVDIFSNLNTSTAGTLTLAPKGDQVSLLNTNTSGAVVASSYKVSSSPQTLSWNISAGNQWAWAAIALTPGKMPSLWAPNINFRSLEDTIKPAGLNTLNLTQQVANFGYKSLAFFQNSFFHTVGRVLNPSSTPTGTIVSEIEQETSQIIIDKVFQGQISAVALSTVTLNMDINIPSPDAVLVVTGGSVIATGAQWASVKLNGNPLTNLVQAAVAGADAEIWYMPYPPVGTSTLSIASGTGGEIYANVMVLLGVDKRSTTIMTASATDAASTSTIGALITPDAPNSLIIDTLSTLNATTFPVQDASQTQVFNATALASSEYVLSTYKLASGQQNMNYNLSVAVNAALVAVSFRPAQSASLWFPNIDFRQLDDTVTVAGLDSEVNPSFGQYGYKPSTFYKNSFLHTVGRIIPPPLILPSDPVFSSNRIIIDQITHYSGGAGTARFQHLVTSFDAVLVAFVDGNFDPTTISNFSVNGTQLPQLTSTTILDSSSVNVTSVIYYLSNPPVGQVDIACNFGASKITVMTLLGVDKKNLTPITFSNAQKSLNPTLNVNAPSANSMIIDNLFFDDDGEFNPVTAFPLNNQSQIRSDNGDSTMGGMGNSFTINSSSQTLAWNVKGAPILNWAYTAIVLEPSQAPSVWYPTLNARNVYDITKVNKLNVGNNPSATGNASFLKSYGYYPTQFFQNSFLHTIGRMNNGIIPVVVTTASGTTLLMMGVG